MTEDMLFLPGLSPVAGKQVQVAFEGGLQSSDGGVLLLREVDRRLGLAARLAACIPEWRDPESISHGIAEIERVASHVALMHAGKLILAESLDELRSKTFLLVLTFTSRDPATSSE